MAITYTDNGGGAPNGSDKEFTYSFPVIQTEDVKVALNGVTQATTKYTVDNVSNPTHIEFNNTSVDSSVQESSGAPKSGVLVRVYRETTVGKTSGDDDPKAVYAAGSSIRAIDLNANTEQALYAIHELQNQPALSEDIENDSVITAKIKDGNVTTAKIADANVTTAKIAADAVNGTKIADDSINSEHYVAGSIDHEHLANDIIDGDNIQDDVINSEHYAAGSIDLEHMSANSVDSDQYVDGSIDRVHLEADIIDSTKLADNAVNSEHYVDGSIDTAHIADSQITSAKIADGTIVAGDLASNAVTTAKITDANVTTDKIADNNVTTAKIADGAVNGPKLATNAVGLNALADGAVDTGAIVNNAVTTAKIADANVTSAKIANNAVTTDKIADSELTTLAGMQSGTASKLAGSTALTADIADLNQIDGLQKATTVTDDDTKFPTSGAIVDYVAAQLEPFGGFEAIANESSFPNTQPVSGVCVSIADAGGMAVSSTGTASGATVGGTTVNISGIPTNFRGSTVNNGVRFIVVSTGSSQNYTYHKATLKEDDLANLSGDINDFSERYRVGSSNPTTSLDNGDLFFNTGTGKMLVYNGTNTAWEEVQSVGNFFINTISAFNGTGGNSATPNGTAYKFNLSNAGLNAEQHLVSVDGVIQKPNSGTSQPSEGFAIDGAAIIFGSAPVSGASIFVITIGSTVNIGQPSNNTVSSAILQNGSVTTAKIADAAVSGTKIAANAVGLNALADGAVDTASIVNGAVTTDKIAADAVTTAKIADDAITAAQIANNAVGSAAIANDSITANELANNSVGESHIIDATITNTEINGSANIAGSKLADNSISLAKLEHGTSSNNGKFLRANNGADPTFETVNTDLVSDSSPQLGGDLDANGNNILFGDSASSSDDRLQFGASQDLNIFHDGTDSHIRNNEGKLIITNDDSGGDDLHLRGKVSEESIICRRDAGVELYHDNSKRIETTSDGAKISGNSLTIEDTGDVDLHLKADSDNTDETHNPTINLYQDGNSLRLKMGVEGTAGTTYSNSGGNTPYLLTTTASNLHLGTNNTAKWFIHSDGHFRPTANGSYDIGSSSARVNNIYTSDLHMSNEGSSNDVDGTWGDWTIQEGESDLFLKNNRSGKKYKFNLTEVS